MPPRHEKDRIMEHGTKPANKNEHVDGLMIDEPRGTHQTERYNQIEPGKDNLDSAPATAFRIVSSFTTHIQQLIALKAYAN